MAATASTPPARDTLIDGRYRLEALLGGGTFGDVWRARDTRLADRPVAVKLLKAEFLEQKGAVTRFDAEADALAQVQHPNIVGVIDRGVWESQRYIAMEFVEGEALSAWIARHRDAGRTPDLVAALGIFDQLCAGIEAAHAVRTPGPIVHRDLKPDNVIVRALPGGDHAVKVLDFGIAQLGQRKGTQTGALMGTPLYMAPEQAMGKVANVGPWTDVFALGVLLVEIVTTHAQVSADEPWWGTSLQRGDESRALLPALRPDVPSSIWDVAARCLRPQGANRYGDASELRAALRQAAMTAFDASTPSQLPWVRASSAVAAPLTPRAPTVRQASSPEEPTPPPVAGAYNWLATPPGEARVPAPAPAPAMLASSPPPPDALPWGRLAVVVAVVAVLLAGGIVAALVSIDARKHSPEARASASRGTAAAPAQQHRSSAVTRALAANPTLAAFVDRWERTRRRAPGADAMERLYATSLKYHGTTRVPDFAQMTRDLDRAIALGGAFALDRARSEWTEEPLDNDAVPAACRAVSDATGPVLRVRAWASETRNDRTPDIGCPRIVGRYLLRMRETSAGLRICHETWSVDEAICSSCPSAPLCARR